MKIKSVVLYAVFVAALLSGCGGGDSAPLITEPSNPSPGGGSTGTDVTPIKMLATSVSAGEVVIPDLFSGVKLQFDVPLDVSTIVAKLWAGSVGPAGNAIASTVVFGDGNRSVTINSVSKLQYGLSAVISTLDGKDVLGRPVSFSVTFATSASATVPASCTGLRVSSTVFGGVCAYPLGVQASSVNRITDSTCTSAKWGAGDSSCIAAAARAGQVGIAVTTDLTDTGHPMVYAVFADYGGASTILPYDVSDPAHPVLVSGNIFPTSLGVVTAYNGNPTGLLTFVVVDGVKKKYQFRRSSGRDFTYAPV